MAKPKYLVVLEEKNNRGCYDVIGWCRKLARGVFDFEGKGIRVITEAKYLSDFGEWDLPLSKEHAATIKRDRKMEFDL